MLQTYGLEGRGPCEVTELFFGSRHAPLQFIDVATAPDKRQELSERLGSPTSGVIVEDGHLTLMQGISVVKLSRYLAEYEVRHPS